MELEVLAYQTQIETLSHAGEIRNSHDYSCVVTPSNPGWFWGTFMVRDRKPRPSDRPVWEAEYDALLADVAGIEHRSFAWNSPNSDPEGLEEFGAAGYTIFRSCTLLLTSPAANRASEVELEIRPLHSDADWTAALQLQELVAKEKYFAGLPPFKERQMAAFRNTCQAGKGEWWGAWDAKEGQLLADMGLFFNSGGNSCLQQVETHPAFRRRGIGAKLLQVVSQRALSHPGCKRLVIQAEADSPAQSFYEDSGAVAIENTVEMTLPHRFVARP